MRIYIFLITKSYFFRRVNKHSNQFSNYIALYGVITPIPLNHSNLNQLRLIIGWTKNRYNSYTSNKSLPFSTIISLIRHNSYIIVINPVFKFMTLTHIFRFFVPRKIEKFNLFFLSGIIQKIWKKQFIWVLKNVIRPLIFIQNCNFFVCLCGKFYFNATIN